MVTKNRNIEQEGEKEMARVKSAIITRKKHKKILKQAKFILMICQKLNNACRYYKKVFIDQISSLL